MSNERSPRASCWMTTGTSGMTGDLLSIRNLGVALSGHGSLSATNELQEDTMPVVERDVVLPVTRERAWELITEPAELTEWLADEVEFEAEEGAPLHVAWD